MMNSNLFHFLNFKARMRRWFRSTREGFLELTDRRPGNIYFYTQYAYALLISDYNFLGIMEGVPVNDAGR